MFVFLAFESTLL